MQLCSVMAPTIEELIFLARRALKEGTDFPEFRLDHLNFDELFNNLGLNKTNIRKITKEFNYAIFTARTEKERGKFSFNLEEKRKDLLQFLADEEVKCIDIEHNYFHQINFNPQKTHIILSYHDFIQTPPIEEIGSLYYEMRGRKIPSGIIKMAYMANSTVDKDRFMEFIREVWYKAPFIPISMGEPGKEGRYEALRIGALLGFGSLEGMPAAPGQPLISDLSKFLESL